MGMFQKSGKNSTSVQVRGSGNVVAGTNAVGNAMGNGSTVISANGNINIRSGNFSIVSDGKTVHIKGPHDLRVYLNDVEIY